jgi:zinc transport system ATP-binding protein
MALISCENVTLGYENIVLVQGLSFRVEEGDYLCIVGENGTGKSTLMKNILHLREPLEGEIQYGDGLKPTEVGYLPQQTPVQRDFPASVWEIVLSGCQSRDLFFYSKESKALARQQMERLGIWDLKDRCYRELSGGQQQRVLLARALCATGKLLLMDEPVSGLDPKVTRELYQLIEKLHKEGIAIIMVSHDIQTAIRYATHILHIGETVFFGTNEEYRKSETGRRFVSEATGEEEEDGADC